MTYVPPSAPPNLRSGKAPPARWEAGREWFAPPVYLPLVRRDRMLAGFFGVLALGSLGGVALVLWAVGVL
jgi:hypothetical protein